ncbi:MAG: TatD family hydrolase [Steroidobacteraceae bacterium]|jgi:TatD DNase family protein|nr:TatD family hydrolase [Steroidobacteraceae bacterium]
MTRPVLVDIGINLAHDSYDHDRDDVIARALAAGVARMVVTGSSLESTARAIELCRQHPGLMRATAGVHPHHAEGFTPGDGARLAALMSDPMVTAGGECGLDYFRNFSCPKAQRDAFARQLEVAVAAGKPVFLHQRDAHADFMAILRDYLPNISRAVVHCFTGTGDELQDYLAAGLYVGITGWVCDERRGLGVKALTRDIPLDRLMIETDGPYLLPRNLPRKVSHRRNEPMYLPYVLRAISEARTEPPTEIADAATANALIFFDLPPLEDGADHAGTASPQLQ